MNAVQAIPGPIDRAAPAHAGALTVRAEDLCAGIDGRPILRNITLNIAPGSSVALLGANGAGKSTLLRVLATLLRPSRGTLALFGHPALGAPTRARIGLVAHQSMLYRDLSALENLEFFARLYGARDPRARAIELLDTVGLAQRARQTVGELSRGMAQRVAIARALLGPADLFLADEPFSGLDAESAERVAAILADLRRRGSAVVLVDHEVGRAREHADRVLVLRAGHTVLDVAASRADDATLRGAMGEHP